MDKEEKIETKPLETVEPIGNRVLIRKDEDKKETKGGIQLPDNIEIPTITGRIVAISAEVENAPDLPLRQYDKVLFNPKGAVPADLYEPHDWAKKHEKITNINKRYFRIISSVKYHK